MSKTLATIVLVFAAIIFFPIVIGICGGLFGIVFGVFGAVFGIIGGIFGAIFGAIGSLFGILFHTSFIAIIIIVCIVAAMSTKSKSRR